MATLLGGLGTIALVISFLDQAGTYRPVLRVAGAGALLVGAGLVFS